MLYSFSYTATVKEAEAAIRNNDLSRAIALYTQLVKRKPSDDSNYYRLMMMFRRQKQYAKELKVINTAIKVVSKAYHILKRYRYLRKIHL